MTESKISVPQLFSLSLFSLFLLPLSVSSPFLSGGFSSLCMGAGLLFLMYTGLFLLFFFADKQRSAPLSPQIQKIIFAVLLLYFMLMSVYHLSLMLTLVKNAVDPKAPAAAVLLLTGAVALFGAKKGTETLARACAAVLFFLVLLVLFLSVSSVFKIEKENLAEIDGSFLSSFQTALSLFSRTSFFPVFFLLKEKTEIKTLQKPLLWLCGAFLLLAFLFFVLVGVLGNFGETQLFPLYTLASVSGAGPFSRMELLHIAFWFLGTVMQCGLLFSLFRRCFQKMCKKEKPWMLCTASAFVVVGSILVSEESAWARFFFHTKFLSVLLVISLVLLFLLTAGKGKKPIAALFCALFFLGGCTAVPLSEKITVQGITVDQTDEGYAVNLLAEIPQKETRQALCLSGEGKTVHEAVKNAAEKNGKTPIFSHDMAVIFGENGEEDIFASLEFFVRYYEFRPTVKVYFSEGKAAALGRFHQGDRLISEELRNLYAQEVSVSLLTFCGGLLSREGKGCAPKLSVEKEKLIPKGAVFFAGGEKRHELTQEEAELYFFISKQKKTYLLSFEKTAVLLEYRSFSEKNKESVFFCKGTVTEMENSFGQAPQKEEHLLLEKTAAENLEKSLRVLFQKNILTAPVSVKIQLNRTEEEAAPLF